MIKDFQTDFIRHCEQLKWFLTLSMKISAVQMLSVSAEESCMACHHSDQYLVLYFLAKKNCKEITYQQNWCCSEMNITHC